MSKRKSTSKPNPIKKDFMEVLEKGATVDALFKDQPMPKGSSPFSDMTYKSQETTSLNELALLSQRKLEVLSKLIPLINRDYFTFGELVSEILSIAMTHISSEGGSFLEMDYGNKCLFFRAVTGSSSKNLLNFTVPGGKGVAGFVCEMQQAMVLADIEDSSVYLKTISDSVGFETRNMMAYPVLIRGKTFGCIELLNRKGEVNYTEDDKELMTTICEYTALIIENRLMLATLSKQIGVAA